VIIKAAQEATFLRHHAHMDYANM